MLAEALALAWASTASRLAIAGVVTVAFTLVAHALRGVNRSGMAAGGAACFLLFAGAGPGGFAALAALFVLTWVSTRFGRSRKQELGIAERGEGRNAWQVLANLAVPALGSALFGLTGNSVWLVATVAALAEAATDTVASEIGQTRGQPAVLITTWQQVPAGTDGGISISGTIAGTIAGLLIAAVAAWGGMIPRSLLWIPVTTGFVGMLIDSALGATVQRRGLLNNEAVNFVSTLASAALAYGAEAISY